MQQEELGDIHWSWLNVGVTGILENISSLIEWCPSGICWIMILWWQRQLMVSRPSWNVNGQRRWVCFWTDVRRTSRPWRSSGAAVLQVSCKYKNWTSKAQSWAWVADTFTSSTAIHLAALASVIDQVLLFWMIRTDVKTEKMIVDFFVHIFTVHVD